MYTLIRPYESVHKLLLVQMKKSLMSNKFERILAQYDYEFPRELIAQAPASPRDSAKLLVYEKGSGETHIDTFLNLPTYLPPQSVVVLNDTKVIPARLTLKKETGGRVAILYLGIEQGNMRILADRHLTVGARLTLSPRIFFTVHAEHGKHYLLTPSFPRSRIFSVLEKYGKTPLPPYIKHTPLSERKLRTEYQTIFAGQKGSIAAPTASLHFSRRLLKKLERLGHTVVYVTLHVNLGTFAPLTEEQVCTEKLHEEYFEINKKAAAQLNKAKKEGRPIIAVGTTTVRTLESSVGTQGIMATYSGTTDLFIQEGYRFKFVDGIITNFHVPKSSLLMLVAAFIGRAKILALYKAAIQKKFTLFSFGDGMAILP